MFHNRDRTATAVAATRKSCCYTVSAGRSDRDGGSGFARAPDVAVAVAYGSKGGTAACTKLRFTRDDWIVVHGHCYTPCGAAVVNVGECTGIGAAFVHGDGG